MNLNDTPTPITEAIWKQKGGVDVDDMIDLERRLFIVTRQRDQLLALADQSTDAHACSCSGCAADRAEFLKLKTEITAP